MRFYLGHPENEKARGTLLFVVPLACVFVKKVLPLSIAYKSTS